MKIPAIQKLGKILDLIGANAQNGCKLMQVPLNLNDLLKGGRWLVKRGDNSVTADPIEIGRHSDSLSPRTESGKCNHVR